MRPGRRVAKLAALSGAAVVIAAGVGSVLQAQEATQPAPTPPASSAPVQPAQPAPTPAQPTPAPGPVDPAAPPTERPVEAQAESVPEKKAERPTLSQRRTRHASAILQVLDKITAETIRFEARVGRPVRYKGLVFTVRSCETTAPAEARRDSLAYVEVRAQPRLAGREDQPSRQVFRGWMSAQSPGVNAMEHPIYDAWLISCKAPSPSVSRESR